MTRAVIIGQSHCAAISQALADDRECTKTISIYRLADSKRPFERDTISLNDAVAIAKSLSSETPVFLSVLGTYHNIIGLLRSAPDFDFLLDGHDSADGKASAQVPHRAIARAFEQNFGDAVSIRKIRAAAQSPFYLLSAPPPKRSNQFIMERLMRQKKQTYRGRTVKEVGVERPLSRLKLWRLETHLMSTWAKAEGMGFVPAPAEALDSDGFLREEFYHDDATHANAGYGALVIKQICEIVGVKTEEVVHG